MDESEKGPALLTGLLQGLTLSVIGTGGLVSSKATSFRDVFIFIITVKLKTMIAAMQT